MPEPRCPLCQAPQEYVADGLRYSRTIGVTVPGVFAGALFWQCPECLGAWHRFNDDHALHSRADPYVIQYNRRRRVMS